MSKKENTVVELHDAVIRFAGDSGDGMQLSGNLFADAAALAGNAIATFPDYPAEIRAPHNTIAGVSGFQARISNSKIHSSGDLADVLVAMNAASLKANLKWAKKGATIVVDADTFDEKNIKIAGYKNNPLEDGSLNEYKLIKAPITSLTLATVKDKGIDNKTAGKTRNMFALGITYFLFNRDFKTTDEFFERKFKKKPQMIEVNKAVIRAGYNFAETLEIIHSTFKVPATTKTDKGKFRNITGNVATAWGLLAASENSGRPLFLGSYPITPATEILMELAQHKSLGAKVFQAEDEIAGICSAIGASFTGSMACTTTSGPGLSLKSEAIGLAVMTELPLVIVNVQRGGPSTGLPTKSEQSDLLQALYGRNGEGPLIIVAASSPADCFYAAYEGAKLSMEHMTPAIVLTDGYIGQGSEVFKIPQVKDLPKINPPVAKPNDPDYQPFKRDKETLVRKWALPGTEGLRHRVGGLEKLDGIGSVSMDPSNHELMSHLREKKVEKIADFIPEQKLVGDAKGDLLVVSWGGSYGSVLAAVKEMQDEGKSVSLAHFRNISPLPKNTKDILKNFKKIVVCELNLGQFVKYLKINFPEIPYHQYNKIQGLPFTVNELKEEFAKILKEN
ncbi:MAG TPA: 2-oxoacid:acceptor oxidoreductase subunit alpha [Bacteroidales bacterium]|mgnify:CR=1 FL=1|nr:2-oxoacid:acceptor oxidoreductase subunit alpha [Bacteroidales bacterium]HPS15599.1 2-oxoacid:acceptor oxidoreductase subunit alpha [Bacteroidales bacterium]